MLQESEKASELFREIRTAENKSQRQGSQQPGEKKLEKLILKWRLIAQKCAAGVERPAQ